VLTKMAAGAPSAVSTQMNDLLALVKKQGDKAFESKQGSALLATARAVHLRQLPGRQGRGHRDRLRVPGRSGDAAGRRDEVQDDERRAQGRPHDGDRQADSGGRRRSDSTRSSRCRRRRRRSTSTRAARPFLEAKPGATGYAPINLQPGTYGYACFFPQGGKKNGKPHYALGMEGTFTVS
jgi:hypothetical protein